MFYILFEWGRFEIFRSYVYQWWYWKFSSFSTVLALLGEVVDSLGWHIRYEPFLFPIFLALTTSCTVPTSFIILFMVVHYQIFLFSPFHSIMTYSIILPSVCPYRRSIFVSKFACMHFVWMFNPSCRRVLMVSVAGFTIIVMQSTGCRLSVAGSSIRCIEMVVALSISVTRRLISTFTLFAVEKKKCMRVR